MRRWGSGALFAAIGAVLLGDIAVLLADDDLPSVVPVVVGTTTTSVVQSWEDITALHSTLGTVPAVTVPATVTTPPTAPPTTKPAPSLIGKILFSARIGTEPDAPTTGPVTPSGKGYNVFVVDGDGKNLRALTTRGRDVRPDLSPDGRSITWISGADNEIWTMDTNGATRRKLATCPLSCGSPKWSPSGDRIAFVSFTGSDGGPEGDDVIVMKADGSQPRTYATPRPEYDVSWSPDGKRLAVDVHFQPAGLFLLDVPSGGWTQIFNQQAFSPDWSPDGKSILFVDDHSRVSAISPEGTGSRIVAASEEQILYVIWTRDGKQMLYVTARGGKYRFALRNADGSGERFITDGSFEVGRPSV
jgi:Tol biopolymer transport system component